MLTDQWRKSTRSHTSGCVEVMFRGGEVWVRDSKLGEDSPLLVFTAAEWDTFVEGVVDGEFDLPAEAVPR